MMNEANLESYVIILQPLLIFLCGFCLFLYNIKNIKWVMSVNNVSLYIEEKKIQRLRCCGKNYDWGRIGSDSQVYRLFSANSLAKIDRNRPYAELWMGTHESGLSYMVINGKVFNNGVFGDGDHACVTLKSWIERNPCVLGDKVVEKWGCDLPFLFKVLSVAKPLSIQAHPCKELARKLHIKEPNVYKDDNHKPEMALAITEFEALCGFVCIEDLQLILKTVPEISQLVDASVIDQISKFSAHQAENEVKVALKRLFVQLMSASENGVVDVLSQLIRRLRAKDKLTSKEELVVRLEEQYPNDVGVLAAFVMNYVKLNPGEALCLGANELHAYVSGDCIECMATSDNVVRAGLTPKKRDVETLCEMLTYKLGRPDILRGFDVDGMNGCTKRYRPPFEEFEVDHCFLSKEGMSTTFQAVAGPSLMLITQGIGTIRTCFSVEKLHVGDVLFVPENTKLNVESDDTGFELYRAGVNSKFL